MYAWLLSFVVSLASLLGSQITKQVGGDYCMLIGGNFKYIDFLLTMYVLRYFVYCRQRLCIRHVVMEMPRLWTTF